MSQINKGEYHNGVFVKIVKPSNFFFKYNGWSLDKQVLDTMEPDQEIVLRVGKNGDILSATAQDFNTYGKSVSFAGMGTQKVLPVGNWKFCPKFKFNQIMAESKAA